MNRIYNTMIDILVMSVSIVVLTIYLTFYFLTLWWIFSNIIKMSIS